MIVRKDKDSEGKWEVMVRGKGTGARKKETREGLEERSLAEDKVGDGILT